MAKMLFAGGRLDSVAIVGAVTEITTAGTFDSSYADCSLSVPSSAGTIYWIATFRDTSNAAVDVVTGETLYFHGEFNPAGTSGSAGFIWSANDSSGNPWLSIRNVSASLYGLYYNSNTGGSPTWTQLGSSFAATTSTTYRYDVKLTLGSPHSVEFSINESAQVTTTFTQASLTGLRSVRGFGVSTGSTGRWSQIMGSEGVSTVGGKVRYSRATGAGTNAAWTGAHTNVNEAIDSTATVDSTITAALKQSYAMGNVTLPSGFVIKSVFHALYAKNDGVAPQNIKSLIRSGATDYSAASNLAGIGTSFAALIERYDNDPNTAAPWTDTNFNAVEAGYLSVT